MTLRRAATLVAMALMAAIAGGCSKAPPAGAAAPHRHEHHPPHGGPPVVLGDEVYHVELVRDGDSGVLQAYILDGEMENFIRSSAPSIEIDATFSGRTERLLLAAVANPATGETVGDTSLFQARADWLKATGQFDGVLRSVPVRGTTFSDVRFNFPRGNDTDG